MENVILINSKNALEKLSYLNYGSVNISFENNDAEQITRTWVDLINFIDKSEPVRITPAVDVYLPDGSDQYAEREMPGVFRISYASNEKPPQLTADEMNMQAIAETAVKSARESLKIRPELFKKAKGLASRLGLKFKSDGDTQYFFKHIKKKSVFALMEEGLYSGVESIGIDPRDIGAQTVRVYASQLSGYGVKKLRVSVVGDTIMVYFGAASKKELLRKDFNKFYTEAVTELGENEAKRLILERVMPEAVTELGENGQLRIADPNAVLGHTEIPVRTSEIPQVEETYKVVSYPSEPEALANWPEIPHKPDDRSDYQKEIDRMAADEDGEIDESRVTYMTDDDDF